MLLHIGNFKSAAEDKKEVSLAGNFISLGDWGERCLKEIRLISETSWFDPISSVPSPQRDMIDALSYMVATCFPMTERECGESDDSLRSRIKKGRSLRSFKGYCNKRTSEERLQKRNETIKEFYERRPRDKEIRSICHSKYSLFGEGN